MQTFLHFKKFLFAVFLVVLVSMICTINHYDGTVYRDLIIAIAAGFFTSQAAVDIKGPTTKGLTAP